MPTRIPQMYVHRKDRCRVPPVREAADRDVSIASAIGLPDCDDRWLALRPFLRGTWRHARMNPPQDIGQARRMTDQLEHIGERLLQPDRVERGRRFRSGRRHRGIRNGCSQSGAGDRHEAVRVPRRGTHRNQGTRAEPAGRDAWRALGDGSGTITTGQSARRPARPSRAPAGAAIPGAGTRARPGRRPTRGWRAPQRAARRRPAAPWPRRPASGRRHGRWPSGSARGVPGAIAGRAFAAIGGAHRVTGLVGRAWRARLIAVPAQAAISSATTRRPAPWGGDQVPLDGAYLAVLTSIFRTESLFSTFRPMRS